MTEKEKVIVETFVNDTEKLVDAVTKKIPAIMANRELELSKSMLRQFGISEQ